MPMGSRGDHDVMMPVPQADAVQQAILMALAAIRDNTSSVVAEQIRQGDVLRDTRERVIGIESQNVSGQIAALRADVHARCDRGDAATADLEREVKDLIGKAADNARTSHAEFYKRLGALERDFARERGFWRPILVAGSMVFSAMAAVAVGFFWH